MNPIRLSSEHHRWTLSHWPLLPCDFNLKAMTPTHTKIKSKDNTFSWSVTLKSHIFWDLVGGGSHICRLWSWPDWDQKLGSTLLICVTWGAHVTLLLLSFLMCKMGPLRIFLIPIVVKVKWMNQCKMFAGNYLLRGKNPIHVSYYCDN